MPEHILKRFEELIAVGVELVPQGGFDYSGYNARLQNKYLEWRKSCLEILELSGPIGFPYKNKILNDQNSIYFYQVSAQLILGSIKELHDKLKTSPELISANSQPSQAAVNAGTDSTVRVLKPPPKKTPPQSSGQPATSVQASTVNKVYVIGDKEEPLRSQLSQFLNEIGLEEVIVERQKGQMLALDSIQDRPDVRYAFFVVNSDDLAYAMFEIGHFVGKLGAGKVCVLCMSDVAFPKNIPGVSTKTIVVKLEEATLGLLKELKAAGYQINI